jgi:hypothetical protein
MKRKFRLVLIVLAVAVIPTVVIWYNIHTISAWQEMRELEKNGVLTEAVLVYKEARRSSKVTTCYFTLRYAAGSGDSLTTVQEVDAETYDLLPVGGRTKLYYEKGAPGNVYLKGNNNHITAFLYSLLGDVLLILFGVWGYFMYKKSRSVKPSSR